MNLRTTDLGYGPDYWNSLDNGRGYTDSVMWEDLAFIVRELFCYDKSDGRTVELTSDLDLIDVGCAFGFLVRHLRRRGLEAFGVDLSPYAVSRAPDDFKDYIQVWDVTGDSEPPVPVPVHLLTCFETMEHISEQDVPLALRRCHDLLMDGGRGLFAICTVERHGWDTDPTHVTIHPRSWWGERLAEAGFARDPDAESWLKQFALFRDHPGIFVVRR